jgi:hypothetical protein
VNADDGRVRRADILAAERDIRRAMDDYIVGIDRMDEELARSAYHADSFDRHGAYQGPGPEFPRYLFGLMRSAGFGLCSHQVTNFVVDLESEDLARVSSSFIATMTKRGVGVEAVDVAWVAGRYVDVFTRRDGQWRISDRTMLVDIDNVGDHHPLYPREVHQHRFVGAPPGPSADC